MEQSALLLALIVSALGVIPLLVGKEYAEAGILAAVAMLILTPFFYFSVPSLVWPFWGFVGVSLFILLCISAFVDGDIKSRNCAWNSKRESSTAWIFPAFFVESIF